MSRAGQPFLKMVLNECGVDIRGCYQCCKCSAGCPVVSSMDVFPNQVLRQIQLGGYTEVLGSRSIWICLSCHTCSARCPNDIDVARVMDSLRHMAIRSKIGTGEKAIPVFHRIFLDQIKNLGRIHELSLILLFKLKTTDFLKDAILGWQMLCKGKIKLFPSHWTKAEGLKQIFSAYKKRRV